MNCSWRCFFIRIKVKVSLKNITENTEEILDTIGIKNKNIISYFINEISHKLTIAKDKIILLRESNNFSHKMTFIPNKETNSEYYIKEYNSILNISIITKEIINNEKIKINYIIKDSNEEYIYEIEVSD